MVSTRIPAKPMVDPARPGLAARIAGIETVPNTRKVPKMPSEKPKSPMRLTKKAFKAAALAEGLWYQKPISKYDARPTPSQPKNICTRLSAVTSISIAKLNSDRYAKNLGWPGSSSIQPQPQRATTHETV